MEPQKKLLNRNFFLLWQGQSISRVGDSLFSVALLFFVKHLTGSATIVGLIQMASTLPGVILGPIGGTYADRQSRRNILIICDLINGFAVLGLASAAFLMPDASNLLVILIFVIATVISIINAFFGPAISASIPDLVPKERINSANSMSQMASQLALFIGQGVGGTLFRLFGAPLLFLVNGISYLFAALSETFVSIPQIIPQKSKGWREQMQEFKKDTINGFHYVWKRSGLRTLVLVSAFLNFLSVPIIVLLPFFVEDTLKTSVDWYGFIVAAAGLGSLLGFVFTGLVQTNGRTRGWMMLVFIILESAGYGALGFVRDPLVALILALVDGFVSGVVTINITTLLQITTPGEIRGRVFGLLSTIAGSMTPIAMGLTGVIADLVNQNIPLIYLSCGGIMLVLSIAVSLDRSFRSFLAWEPEPTAAVPTDDIAVPTAP